MEIPDPIVSRIDAAFEAMRDDFRPAMGPSQAGEPCERKTWLSFRWAVRPHFPGRMLRLFGRGQREEAVVISMLKMIGMEVDGSQTGVPLGGHLYGHVDGIITKGVPQAPTTKHVLEIKTHNVKSFDGLTKGVKESKPQHYAQMQLYMLGLEIDRALYVAVCKDDDRMYTERVELDIQYAEKEKERLQRITVTEKMPPPISTDPSWYQCKFCDARDMCHGSKLTREVNCRTCAHSTPLGTGAWHCMRWANVVPVDWQREGCGSHTFHPDMVPWRLDPSKSTEWAAWYEGVGLVGEGGLDSKSFVV